MPSISDSRCGLACDASACDAKSLAMWFERCEPLRLELKHIVLTRVHAQRLMRRHASKKDSWKSLESAFAESSNNTKERKPETRKP